VGKVSLIVNNQDWVKITEVPGDIQGEIIKGLLNANSIPTQLNQEGAGRAYGIMSGPLGAVQIFVPKEFAEDAKQILKDYEQGKYEEDAR